MVQNIIKKMELFLSLNRKTKKSKLSPGTKKKIIDLSSLNNTSTSTNRSTKTVSNQRNSLSFRSSRLKSNEKSFVNNSKMLSANTDLKFVKIKSKENINMSTSLDSEEEERIISSLQEGIKILPNGCYLIQATKILNMNRNNSKIDTKQSDANTSTTICSSNTNGCKRISLPFKPKDKLSPIKSSICKSNSNNNNIMKEKKVRRISPKYANKTFNTYYSNLDSNRNNSSKAGKDNTNKKQKLIRMYFNHCTTLNNKKI